MIDESILLKTNLFYTLRVTPPAQLEVLRGGAAEESKLKARTTEEGSLGTAFPDPPNSLHFGGGLADEGVEERMKKRA